MQKDLEALYDKCKELIIDSKDVVEEVEKYRRDWKPTKTTIVLLAESHAHTTQEEFNRFLKSDFQHNDGTRCRYVNYVYCIGNSESFALEHEDVTKRKTYQYWRIFYSCLHVVSDNSDFHDFEKGSSEDRVKRKKELLHELARNGIWLLDSSIIGINVLDNEARQLVFSKSWEFRLEQEFKALMTEGLKAVIIIGGTVNEALRSKLQLMNLDLVKVDQPQRRLKGGYITNYGLIYKTCEKYRIH